MVGTGGGNLASVDQAIARLKSDAVEWRLVEGEIVALDLRDSVYLAVNSTGATLWPLLVDGSPPERLVDSLVATYDISRAQAREDVSSFLAALRERDLLAN